MLKSPFANLYQQIIERIKTNVPSVRYADQDVGQLDHYSIKPAVSWPCCLIEVAEDFTFTDSQNEKSQIGIGFVVFRIGLVKYTDSNNLVPSNIRENALKYFDIEQELYEAMHGWAPANFGKLLRRKSQKEQRNDDILVRIAPYEISFTDDSAATKKTTVARPNAIINQL